MDDQRTNPTIRPWNASFQSLGPLDVLLLGDGELEMVYQILGEKVPERGMYSMAHFKIDNLN